MSKDIQTRLNLNSLKKCEKKLSNIVSDLNDMYYDEHDALFSFNDDIKDIYKVRKTINFLIDLREKVHNTKKSLQNL